jgi:ribosome-binding factor A
MHQETNRPRRVAHLLQREVANLIKREVNDPRVQHVTITGVEVSRDLSRAKVFFTCLDTDTDAKAAEKALNHAKDYLRHHLKSRLDLRGVPHLRFVYDESVEHGAHISELIDRAIRRDTED